MFASRDLMRAKAYQVAYGGVAAFGSYAEAFQDPRVHAVVICTPHDLHVEHARLAASYGKHLLIEKPLARSLEEADQIIDAAEKAEVTLMVGENFRFMPAFRQVRAYLREGRLGGLREIQLSARGERSILGWRLSQTAMGGGTLIDGGIHYINLLHQWGERVESVFAMSLVNRALSMEGEDSVVMVARLSGGAVGTLSNSVSTPGCFRTQWASVSGSDGSVFVDNQGRFLFLRCRSGSRIRLYRRDRRGHCAMLHEFVQAIHERRAPQMDAREGRRDLAVVMAAYRSIAEQRSVEVEW
jgi:predicted dehydrogenase